MKQLLCILTVILAFTAVLPAQNNGELLPLVYPVFTNVNGVSPVALGFVCTTTSGTNTNLATYRDTALTVANANPILLNAYGRAVNGSTLVPIFLLGQSYRITLYAAGTGNTCNGSAVGTQIWQQDGVYNLAELFKESFVTKLDDKVCHAAAYTGTSPNDMGGKIAACVAVLPSTGGTVDARGLEGAQTISSDPFNATSKAVQLLLGFTTITVSATIIIPASSGIIGEGVGTKLNASGLTAEMFRLKGDSAYVERLWAHGAGQDANTPDGKRAFWLGCSVPTHTVTCNVNYPRLQYVMIDAFSGNGVSGDFTYGKILNNIILNTTDAGIFFQPSTTLSEARGNYVSGSRYSCIDINGTDNLIIANTAVSCGGGNADQASQSGIIVVSVAANANSGSRNKIISNYTASNKGCGVRIYGANIGANIKEPYGNLVEDNTALSHTTAYTDTSPTTTEWTGGICMLGGDGNVARGNHSGGNVFNYVVTGFANVTANTGTILENNESWNAVTNAALTGAGKSAGAGYFFPGGVRIDGAGAPSGIAGTAVIDGNWDRYPAGASFLWALNGGAGTWSAWTIKNNHSENAGTYGMQVADLASFALYSADCSNYATGAATANYLGFPFCSGTAVLQVTSKATGVTQNGAINGRITLCSDATCGAAAANTLAAAGVQNFDITNTSYTTGRDRPWVSIRGGPNAIQYSAWAIDQGASTIRIYIKNNDVGAHDDAIQIDYGFDKR